MFAGTKRYSALQCDGGIVLIRDALLAIHIHQGIVNRLRHILFGVPRKSQRKSMRHDGLPRRLNLHDPIHVGNLVDRIPWHGRQLERRPDALGQPHNVHRGGNVGRDVAPIPNVGPHGDVSADQRRLGVLRCRLGSGPLFLLEVVSRLAEDGTLSGSVAVVIGDGRAARAHLHEVVGQELWVGTRRGSVEAGEGDRSEDPGIDR
mmetsp:Transcript_7792/g.18450  ORF Transcript_7792/g.18450 Transcript_7792/m.18450 type:complete len:204 (+) Transcript_7792:516-1127(+)